VGATERRTAGDCPDDGAGPPVGQFPAAGGEGTAGTAAVVLAASPAATHRLTPTAPAATAMTSTAPAPAAAMTGTGTSLSATR
jgi:hypothetical protein